MRVALTLLLAAAALCGGCSAAASLTAPTADTQHTLQSPAASSVLLTVAAFDYDTHAPLQGVTVTLQGSHSASCTRTTDSTGSAQLPAFVGDSIIVDVRSDSYAAMSAAAILTTDHERWSFFLTRLN